MTVAEYKRRQKEELAKQKLRPIQKISNNFIDNTLSNASIGAIKTIYYLATIIEKMEQFEQGQEKGLLKLEIDMRQMLKYTGLTLPTIKRNIKSMQETSISFIDEVEGIEEGISLLPYYKIIAGKHKLHIEIFQKIATLIVEVKNNYTPINTKDLMNLKKPHSIRLLPLLITISRYDKDVGKRKKLQLLELNEFFGTKYTSWAEIERSVLRPTKKELDNNSKISFIYEPNFENLGTGRPRFKYVTIDVIKKN